MVLVAPLCVGVTVTSHLVALQGLKLEHVNPTLDDGQNGKLEGLGIVSADWATRSSP